VILASASSQVSRLPTISEAANLKRYRIVHVFPVVVAVHLRVEVAKQMEGSTETVVPLIPFNSGLPWLIASAPINNYIK
jgi:hypothetical protein